MRFGVIMDPLSTVKPKKDTSYALMLEMARRGHEVVHLLPSELTWRDGMLWLRGEQVDIFDAVSDPAVQPFEIVDAVRRPATDFDALLVRTDPPFDADYLYVTMLLERVMDKVFVMNNPVSVRAFNEKLAATLYPDLTPRTVITASIEEIRDFMRQVGRVVVKPLDGFGGDGVLVVSEDDLNRSMLLRMATAAGTRKVVAQEFLPATTGGDKRIIVLEGEPLGAVLRKAGAGEHINNFAQGGSANQTNLDDFDRAMCERLKPFLREHGLYLVGLDVIGQRLIEINVTSPTGVQEINRLNGARIEEKIVDLVEREAGLVDASAA